jgi:hypothetical protein
MEDEHWHNKQSSVQNKGEMFKQPSTQNTPNTCSTAARPFDHLGWQATAWYLMIFMQRIFIYSNLNK